MILRGAHRLSALASLPTPSAASAIFAGDRQILPGKPFIGARRKARKPRNHGRSNVGTEFAESAPEMRLSSCNVIL
jgi:hypothetical protein